MTLVDDKYTYFKSVVSGGGSLNDLERAWYSLAATGSVAFNNATFAGDVLISQDDSTGALIDLFRNDVSINSGDVVGLISATGFDASTKTEGGRIEFKAAATWVGGTAGYSATDIHFYTQSNSGADQIAAGPVFSLLSDKSATFAGDVTVGGDMLDFAAQGNINVAAGGFLAFKQNNVNKLVFDGFSTWNFQDNNIVTTGTGSFGVGSAATPSHSFQTDSDTGMYTPLDNTLAFTTGGDKALQLNSDQSATFFGSLTLNAGPKILAGSGTPEGSATAPVGSTYQRTDGGSGTSFYVKESGTGNTGWVSK